jgi:hypothetical protein
MLLYAEFVPAENTWVHSQAAQAVMQTYGLPLRYYVDNLRVFRFVQYRDSFWRQHRLGTDEVDPQWRQVLRQLNVGVIYALSPQAKGKVERPYRWLQDRIVRTCALEKISAFDETRAVLREEVHRYNYHQVHSTTGEIPAIRFEKAKQAGNSLFRPFALPKPYRSVKDVFCLRTMRIVDGYRKISLDRHAIEVPKVDVRHDVELHLVPDFAKNVLEVRIWFEDRMVHSVNLPLHEFHHLG